MRRWICLIAAAALARLSRRCESWAGIRQPPAAFYGCTLQAAKAREQALLPGYQWWEYRGWQPLSRFPEFAHADTLYVLLPQQRVPPPLPAARVQ